MNSKVLLAFIGGLVVASGLTFVLMSRPAPVPARTVQATAPAVQTPAPVSQTSTPAPEAAAPAPQPDAPRSVAPPVESARHAQPHRVVAKPSPVVARDAHPVYASLPEPPAPAPAPVKAPVNAQVAQAPLPVAQPPVQTAEPQRAPEPVPTQAPADPAPPPAPAPHSVTIPAGTLLSVRLGESLSSERNEAGDTFTGTLDQPLIVDGFVIAERGSRVQGRVVQADRAGRVRGVAHLAIALTHINTSDGQRVKVNTAAFNRDGESSRKSDAEKVGIGAALGAAIGAMAGGGKGAAIGAGAGGAAGAGDVMMTRGKPAELATETRISFRLQEPVPLTERLH